MSDRDFVERLRALLDNPFAVCEALGQIDGRRSFQRQARGVTVFCPAHDERTPSCSVTRGPDGTLRFRCFGCDASGDVFDLIAQVERLDRKRDFPRVLEIAAGMAHVALDGATPRYIPPRHVPPAGPPPLEADAFDALVCALEAAFPLAACGEACAYLDARGLLEAVGAAAFALPLDARRVRDVAVAAIGDDAWRRSGLANAAGALAWADHRLCFAWRAGGVDGTALTLQRRLMRAPRRASEPKYVTPAGRALPPEPFGLADALEHLGPATAVAFVEGVLDALALRALAAADGLDWVALGVPGCKGWRPAWAAHAQARVAVIAFDADAAGEGVVEAIANDLRDAGAARVQRARPADAQDWSELLGGDRRAA